MSGDLRIGSFLIGADAHLVRSVEEVGGSDGADTLIGSAAAKTFNGHEGDDHIEGPAGNEVLDGGSGIDFLDGGTASTAASAARRQQLRALKGRSGRL